MTTTQETFGLYRCPRCHSEKLVEFPRASCATCCLRFAQHTRMEPIDAAAREMETFADEQAAKECARAEARRARRPS